MIQNLKTTIFHLSLLSITIETGLFSLEMRCSLSVIWEWKKLASSFPSLSMDREDSRGNERGRAWIPKSVVWRNNIKTRRPENSIRYSWHRDSPSLTPHTTHTPNPARFHILSRLLSVWARDHLGLHTRAQLCLYMCPCGEGKAPPEQLMAEHPCSYAN